MNVQRRAIVVSSTVVILVAILAVVFWPRGEKPQDAAAPAQANRQAGEPGQADAVMGGRAEQRGSDVQPVDKAKAQEASAKPPERDPFDYGVIPPVKADANPQVKAVVEAIRKKEHPERVSVLMRGKAFDAKAYKADPKQYLETVEPGRVFQTAQPGPGVPHLAPVGDRLTRITQGQTTKLRVRAPAGSPVSFTSFDTGRFENLLTAITVPANAQGIAEVTFEATPGTIEDVNILAGSPMAASQVKFVVNVQMPDGGTMGEVKN
jgi:hypothetical protein